MNISGIGGSQPSYSLSDFDPAQMQRDINQVNTDIQELEQLMSEGVPNNVLIQAYNQAVADYNTAYQYLLSATNLPDFGQNAGKVQDLFHQLLTISNGVPVDDSPGPDKKDTPTKPFWD